ncbi:hypothetical protein BC829DRAFT_424481 [Chytridium lagenaria]|nr:hypothetical protein BC829DRAFT_424481 [Chytridium lagenaria]
MRCFISNVDTPLGHNLGRVLSSTAIGSRREQEPDDEEGSTTEDGRRVGLGLRMDSLERRRTRFLEPCRDPDRRIWMIMERWIDAESSWTFDGFGDKKKDGARREQIEKFAVPGKTPKWVSEVVPTDDKEELTRALTSADVIIYDIVQSADEAAWAIEIFIGISTIMTWAKTKVDQDDPDAFLAEDEYRRRKPHPNFKNHIGIEKNIIKAGKKSALHTYSAWHNDEELVCFGDGNNIVPTIHLDDLCNIIVEVAETTPESKYFLAIDESKNSLYEITKKLPKEIALVNKGLPQSDYDMLLVNLRLEPGHVKDMTFEWKYESEYKDARGKTQIARQIAQHYEIHYIEVETIVKEAVTKLESRIAEATASEDSEEDVDGLKDFLEELREAYKANNGKYPDHHVINFVKDKLKSMPCRNQGYVLDGYPTNLEEAASLFKSMSEEDAKEERSFPNADELIIPEFIISLEASDEFIKERIMNIPEASLEHKNTEEVLVRRLEEYRNQNTEENTVLNFFDELEIHPLIVPIESKSIEAVLEPILKHLGQARNYGPSPEQIAEKKRVEEEKRNARMEEIRKQEQDVLEAQSVPLRNYLMKYVMPTLTTGLIEVCKARPDDPIDYLAEFLFKHNSIPSQL